ncbi:MAG: hypothetical protein AAF513_12660 [Pseudomonadota bacterium]
MMLPDDITDKDDEILEDLESIKDLLHPEDETHDIPVLDDFVEEPAADNPGLDQATIDKLLQDTWQDSVEELFSETRRTIEANAEAWLPEDTDDLTQALRVRIDTSVKAWLAQTLSANIGELHKHVVRELSEEIIARLEDKLGERSADSRDDNL